MPGYGTIPYLIGLTDFLFFAIFFQAAVRFELGIKKNVLLLLASFFIAVAAAIFFATGLPVLPFMAVLFVVGNFKRLSLKKEEIRQILLFVVFIIIAFTLISKFAH
jgi:nitric oxide reductase large subunit